MCNGDAHGLLEGLTIPSFANLLNAILAASYFAGDSGRGFENVGGPDVTM